MEMASKVWCFCLSPENGEHLRLRSTVTHDSAKKSANQVVVWHRLLGHISRNPISQSFKPGATRAMNHLPEVTLFGLPHELASATWYFENFPRHSAELKESWYYRTEIPPWFKSHADASPFENSDIRTNWQPEDACMLHCTQRNWGVFSHPAVCFKSWPSMAFHGLLVVKV